MCYIAHVVACFWYLIGGDEPHDDADLLPQPGWISREMIDVWNVTGDRTEVRYANNLSRQMPLFLNTLSTEIGIAD